VDLFRRYERISFNAFVKSQIMSKLMGTDAARTAQNTPQLNTHIASLGEAQVAVLYTTQQVELLL